MDRKQYDEHPYYYQENQSFYDNTEARLEGEKNVALYLAKVMAWMCAGLFITMATAIVCYVTPSILFFLFSSEYTFIGVFVVQLGLVVCFSFLLNKINAAVATVLYLLYSAFTGITFTVLAIVFTIPSIISIFGLTALVFLLMAVYGYTTKKDLTRIGSLALFGLVGIILTSLVNLFIKSTMMELLICCVGIVIFMILIGYDTQKIKEMYYSATAAGHEEGGDQLKKIAIFGAFNLYLDFINLFLRLLQLFGRRRN